MSLQDLLERMVHELDECVHVLSQSFPQPGLVPRGDAFVFRHQNKSALLLMYLKAVKIASNNNAAMVLIRSGYVQETYALCRMIDEACDDILFMASPDGDDGQLSRDQLRFLEEFFQAEIESPGDPLSSAKRDRVPRRSIHAALSRMRGAESRNPSLDIAVGRTLHRTFSGFVHGAYVHVMELFEVPERRFHTRGLIGTLRIEECEDNHINYVYRSLGAVEAVSTLADRPDVASRLHGLRLELARQTGCDPGMTGRRTRSSVPEERQS